MSSEYGALMRDYLADRYPERSLWADVESESGHSADLWHSLSIELGLPGLALPSRFGGSELPLDELAAVAQEMGRALVCSPFLSTVVLSANALLLAEDESVQERLLPEIIAGTVTVAVAHLDGDQGPEEGRGAVAVRGVHGWTIDGTRSYVIDGGTASHLLVFARTSSGRTSGGRPSGGLSLFLVDGHADGLTRTPVPTLDLTRRLAHLHLAGVGATLVGEEGRAGEVLARLHELAAVFLAAEAVGGTRRCLEMSVEHATTRHQFGRAIGSFQAVKHRCAEMLIRVELAESAALHAADALVSGTDLPLAASMAKAYCGQAYSDAAATALQIHGGIGFTWEHPVHLHLKRARSSSVLFGSPLEHRWRVGELLGLSGGGSRVG